jgi:hypothetical protein
MSEVTEASPATVAPESNGQAAAISLPQGFRFDQVVPAGVRELAGAPPVPALGPLAAFVGTWRGRGFNTIFRPQNAAQSPTPLPKPAHGPDDNILELNLTNESLAFSPALGSVPNRGMVERDRFLNGVPYLQTISDVTDPARPVGIHVEPGIWMCVPVTAEENEQTLVRMGSIPHGTTITAQGTSSTIAGAPTIPPAPITPFSTQPAGAHLPPGPPALIRFPSQTAADQQTFRIPQDLSSFIAAGTITQAILDDPNTLLRNHNAGLHIVQTTVITISTAPVPPLFGGGTDNIDFLLGNAASLHNPQAGGENAQTLQMTATFWIETVEDTFHLPHIKASDPPVRLKRDGGTPPRPIFRGKPPHDIPAGKVIKLRSTQIQYSQTVMLNFNGLTWPHVSVATLVPAPDLPIPPAAWN